MFKGSKRICAVALALIITVLCFLTEGNTVFASKTDTAVTMEFVGDEREKAGFAQCEITVTPGDGSLQKGYYVVYYTDGEKVLPDYDEVTAIKINGKNPVKGYISDGIMLPANAKGIAVFECETYFMAQTPDIKDSVTTAEIPVNKRLPALGEAEFSFGALSDTHMNYEQHDRGAYAKLGYAMDFYAQNNMDIVIISGDATGDRGENPDLEAQYEKHIEIINGSDFSFDKVYEGIGNHGNTQKDAPLLDKYLGGEDEIHPFEGSPYFHVLFENDGDKRDNLFIFMAQELKAPGDSASYDNFSKEQIDWLEGLLAQYGNTHTNIFIIEHAPFLGYGAGDVENGTYTACVTFKEEYAQNMRLKALLETYKDTIVMSGHTHVSFYEDANYSDEYNAFARTVHIGSSSQPCAYGEGASLIRSYDGRREVTPEYGSEGYTVEIYSDYIVYTGYNFSTGKKIPAACLLIPVKAYGGPGKPETPVYTPEEAFEGSGTAEDPYIIADAEDFKMFTDGFNAANSATESEMYGYGKYFLQTGDIDMTSVEGYSGTVANGNNKCFFAGVYNGNGYTLKVDIDDTVQRSVFPYVYGVICNLKIEGSITSQTSAQPVRTLYGSIVNCIFELELSADIANGVLYSNYSLVYNVYTCGTLAGTELNPVASNDSSTDYVNVFHCYTFNGSASKDDHGTRTEDCESVASAFNNRSGAAYENALAKLGGMTMLEVASENGSLVFVREQGGETSAEESVSESSATVSDTVSADTGSSKLWIFAVALAVVIIAATAVLVFKKK